MAEEMPRTPLPEYAQKILGERKEVIVSVLTQAFGEVKVVGLAAGDDQVTTTNHAMSVMTDMCSTAIVAVMEQLMRVVPGVPLDHAMRLVLSDFTTRTQRRIDTIRTNMALLENGSEH